DPLEGTRLTALGQPNAIAVLAVAERGTMFFPGAAVYMEKIATGPDAIGAIDITATPTENVRSVAAALKKTPRDVQGVVLERDRRHDRSAPAWRPVHARRRDHRLDRHAITLGNRAPGPGPAQLREAVAALRPRISIVVAGNLGSPCY